MHRYRMLLLAACLMGCSADYPAGAIVCSESSECPKGMSCLFARGSEDGRCFPGGDVTQESTVNNPDASSSSWKPRDAGSPEKPSDAGSASGGRGGSGEDEPKVDAGADEPRDAGSAQDSGAQAGSGGSPDVEPDAGGRDAGAGGADAPAAGSGGATPPAAGSGGGGDATAAGSGGTSEPPEPCDDPARECDPADIDTGEELCGLCDQATRTRTRSCNPTSCRWEAWSTWSACADPAECTPGTSQSRSAACPGCGSKSQTRVCSQTTCKYEAWRDASSCSWCDACGELVFCDTPDDVAPNRGTWCRPQNGCSNEQAWGRCLEILEENTCRLHEPRYIGN